MTHSGGTAASVLAVLLPATDPALLNGAYRAGATLAVSHLAVQLLKRSLFRGRPAGLHQPLVAIPDQFSFPSGHATAAMAVAVAWALTFPVLLVPLTLVAFAVGLSRVVLGVHFLGDVLAGQVIATLTATLFHGAF